MSRFVSVFAFASAVSLGLGRSTEAQSATASLRGHIYGTGGAPVSDAQVQLTDPASGLRRGALTNASGFYNVAAVPPSTYTVRVLRIGFSPVERTVRLQVGETVTLDLTLSEAAAQIAGVTVIAAAGSNIRTAEIATNITPDQIENLPQGNRNFLDFAALAPGVQQRGAGISAGGSSVSNSNLFIDGASYKSDVLPGGIAGQDPSLARNIPGVGLKIGNPFPQSAVQEFRVITQNYKAEYQKASGAVVTAATKTGTNELHGDLFYYGQNESFIARSAFQLQRAGLDVPNYRRSQFGASVGGPIIRDRAHFFVSYEGNFQNSDTRVLFQRPNPSQLPPGMTVPDSIFRGEGLFELPLREHLFFGKATYQLTDRQDLMLTANLRRERDDADFGGNTSELHRNHLENDVTNLLLRHTLSSQPFTNEAQLNYQRFNWKQLPAYSGAPRLIYRFPCCAISDVITGANLGFQNFIQDRVSLRNALTWTAAAHVVKVGGNADFLRYDVDKRLRETPTFFFATDAAGGLTSPYFAELEVGRPDLVVSNQQFGLFAQDDWTVTPRLTLNLGVRWDYETDWLNNDFVTPQGIRDSVAQYVADYEFFRLEDYVTDGDDRKNFYKGFQPRLGFSFDVTGDNRTVVFGGGGLFYDRINYNLILDERYKLQRPVSRYNFVPPGATPGPGQTVFDPRFFSREQLLSDPGAIGSPEVFLINNNQEPPYTLQYSLGARRNLGAVTASVTGTLVNGHNYLKWIWGNRDPSDRSLHFGPHGIGALIISTDEGRSWYRGLLVNVSKPFLADSRWGGDLSYTLSKTEVNHFQDIEDPFAFDYIPNDPVFGFDRIPSRFDERHRVVLNLLTRLPFGVRASTVTTLGSGNPYTLTTGCTDPNSGDSFCASQLPPANIPDFFANPGGVGPRSERPEGKWFGPFGKWAYRNVDLRLQTDLSMRGQTLGVSLDVLNVFNFTNYNFAGANFVYLARPNNTAPLFPQGENDLFNSRRMQLGARYSF